VNYYRLNYFLADGTIEVKEIRKQNNGKDPFPLLLRRSKLPKAPFLTHYPVIFFFSKGTKPNRG
jgi:hypothetical protein